MKIGLAGVIHPCMSGLRSESDQGCVRIAALDATRMPGDGIFLEEISEFHTMSTKQ
jgi:hypothetical protein